MCKAWRFESAALVIDLPILAESVALGLTTGLCQLHSFNHDFTLRYSRLSSSRLESGASSWIHWEVGDGHVMCQPER